MCKHERCVGITSGATVLIKGARYRAARLFCPDCEAVAVLSYEKTWPFVPVPIVPRLMWVEAA